MADVVFIAVTAGFFGACVAYVRGLDRLVRSSGEGELSVASDPSPGTPASPQRTGQVAA